MENKLTFRNAERKDTGLILQFIKELADYEKMLDQVVADEETLKHGFLISKKQRLFLRWKMVKKSVLHCFSIISLHFLDVPVFIWRICMSSLSVVEKDMVRQF